MAELVPKYIEKDRICQADTCGPFLQATETGRIRFRGVKHGHYPGWSLSARVMPELKTLGFFDAKFNQEWGTEWHYNEGIEVCLVENGRATFCVEDGEYPLGPLDLSVTRPWQRHRLGNPFVTAVRLHWLVVDLGNRSPEEPWHWPPWILLTSPDCRELTDRLEALRSPVLHGDDLTLRCFQRMAAVMETGSPDGQTSLLAVLVNEVFVLLLQTLRRGGTEYQVPDVTGEEIVQLFWEELRSNPGALGHSWRLSDLARACGLGVTRFVDLTRRVTNLPPMQFLNRCRLDLPAQLRVEKPWDSVTEVALTCGFGSGQQFANSFRRGFGVSPSLFRTVHGLPSAAGLCGRASFKAAGPR